MRGQRDEGSFALVSTLLIVAVMALGALAFFQTARMDRLVTRNTADRVRAELAAESGLAMASAQLQSILTNDTFVITLSATTNPLSSNQLYAGHWQTGAAAGMSYRPLFSAQPTATNLTGLRVNTSAQPEITNIPWSANSATSPTVRFTNWSLPGGLRMTSPALYWMAITNTNGVTTARFAFWVEDLAGRLDLSVAGSIGTNAARPTGTNPAELALWSLFSPGVTNDLSNAVVAALLTNGRSAVPTAASARLASPSVTTNLMADLAARLVHPSEVEVIPYGFGYVDAGRPKFNINSYISSGNLTNLAEVISSNLPNFSVGRRGGFPANEDYVLTLAASAIDYADTNSTPTVGPGYRGVDATPFVTILYSKYDWFERNPNNIRVRLFTFVQLWNLSDKTISGDFTFNEINNDTILEIGWARGAVNRAATNLTLQPNEIRVLSFIETNTIGTGVFPVTNTVLNFADNGSNNTYFFESYWNSALVDRNPIGAQRKDPGTAKNMTLSVNGSGSEWTGHLPALRYGDSVANPAQQQTGDPRSTYYIRAMLENQNYRERTAWGGMAVMRPAPPRYFTQPWLWADPVTNNGSSVPPPGSSVNLSIASSNTFQLTNGAVPASTNLAPQKINNTGLFQRITELGNLYDPAQWHYSTYSSNSIPTNATPSSSYGGGMSLRIGKAEHPRFTSDGTRASQLLDLFAAGPTGGNNGVTNFVAGRINLNTATTNTLRALAAGVFHTNDPALVSSAGNGTNFVVPAAAVTNFIGGVTNFRRQRPFFSASQLNDLTNGAGSYPSNAVFGNPTFGTGTNVVSQWHDAAAEEWFSKIYPLATVRSRNFLVHVVGQAMSTNTNSAARPLASSRKLFQVYAAPIRNADGLTTNVTMQIVGAWDL